MTIAIDMAAHPAASVLVNAVAPTFALDRREAIPALIGRHEDFLIIAGLGGTAWDIGALTRNAPHVYPLSGSDGRGPP